VEFDPLQAAGMIALPPKVQPGDPFTAKLWNQMRDAVAALRPQAGANTRILQNPNNFVISFDPSTLDWSHPFRISQTGKTFTVQLGLINQVEPTIQGLPISGIDKNGKSVVGGAPKLTIASDYDSEGRNWVVLKVTTDELGKIKEATIIQTSTWPQPLDPYTGYHPIAMFKKSAGNAVLFQQTYHNLAHQWIKPSTGLGRHFFWAV
jgi:hypothetical protein